ncbi:ABC transporter permease [Actinomyces sp. zg-332]|uniref:methionine ABC transporter permease n=1 Tax=Actinomyces sp. zg-332 TaxID=2708340 RepID=UPI00141FEE58|nr:methionine ABC transporter permease [Actinomyces sp. zg-332]QPK94060.1 ABC transporter permease [Actinomyces sp. zg-332]
MLTYATSLLTNSTDGTWFSNPVIKNELLNATLETLQMSFISAFFTVLIGIPLGLAVVATSKKGLVPNAFINNVLSIIINVGRSIPFIILMIAIIPFTKLIVGTSVGWQAAVLPLTVGAIPFFARLVESAVIGVDQGKVEATQMMGASRRQILGVLVLEALPAIVQSITVLVITLISYSAMAGAIGGGGLGSLAINYGYQRFMTDVMVITVVIIVLIVQIVQMVGDMISRLVDHR